MAFRDMSNNSPLPELLEATMADTPGRPMKFPYTFAAKVAQFPYKMYFTQQWIWKYYAISLVISAPLFYKIQKLGKSNAVNIGSRTTPNPVICYLLPANSPEAKAKWAEQKKKELEAHH